MEQTLDFVVREMSDPAGGFFSSLDADSEGVEGKFYVWTLDEVAAVLGKDAGEFCERYDITTGGNFEGSSIPNLIGRSLEQQATDDGVDEFSALMLAARRTEPPLEIAVIGHPEEEATRALLRTARRLRRERRVLAAGEDANQGLPLLRGKKLLDGRPAAYVCRNDTCAAPTSDPGELARQLGL